MRFFRLLIPVLLVLAWSIPAAAEDTGWRAPLSVEGATTITAEEALKLHEDGVAFIDLRNPRLHARRHVPGAHHLDLKTDFNEKSLAAVAGKDDPVVLYCSGVKCSRSYRATEQALAWGYSKIYFFRGGIVEWKNAGYPMESGN